MEEKKSPRINEFSKFAGQKMNKHKSIGTMNMQKLKLKHNTIYNHSKENHKFNKLYIDKICTKYFMYHRLKTAKC